MSVTSGFFPIYESVEDRKYDSRQISGVFQGLYLNGVSSVIGNGFSCKVIDKNNVKVSSGFGYFNRTYIYNDSDYIINIPDDFYPVKKRYVLRNLEVSNPPQLNYPYGNQLDLGDFKVDGLYEYEDLDIIYGECYIVIRYFERDRKYSIESILFDDYNPKTDYIIAVGLRNEDEFKVLNTTGRYKSIHIIDPGTNKDTVISVKGPAFLPSINTELYLTDMDSVIDETYDKYQETFEEGKVADYNIWFQTQQNILNDNQYVNLTNELADKESNLTVLFKNIDPGDTYKEFEYLKSSDVIVDTYTKPYGLYIKNIEETSNSIKVYFDKEADRSYTLKLIIKEV